MKFIDGLAEELIKRDDPIITDYGFFVLGKELFELKEWNGERLKYIPKEWDYNRARNALRRLTDLRIISSDVDFHSGVWRVVQSTNSGTAEEIACISDPFCYVSHLSAMHRYNLTERSPEALHITTPVRAVWNKLRNERVSSELGDSLDNRHPALMRLGFKGMLRRRPVIVHETNNPAIPVDVRGGKNRIASIGRTFADMLVNPMLCGGIRHVLQVWENYAEQWLRQIVDEIDKTDSQIVKVRAGYIFTEMLDIENSVIDSWDKFSQRGGSRKLNPDAEYSKTYSERWMISINV